MLSRVDSLPRIKICCISSIEEAKIAIDHGAHAIGLVSRMPSGPGVISEDLIAEIARYTPPAVTSVLLTSYQSVREIIKQHQYCRTNAIQICDKLQTGTFKGLREALPGISLIQVIHVTGSESIDEAVQVSSQVDALLLDSGKTNADKLELGGTGRIHDWSVSEEICKKVEVPLFLAGGLNPQNIQEAVRKVQPFGVDVCSGVRTDGRLDTAKLYSFIHNLRSG